MNNIIAILVTAKRIKMRQFIKVSLLCSLVIGMFSCGGDSSDQEDLNLLDDNTASVKSKELDIPREKLYEVIQQIPSPLEISKLIEESGAVYNEEMLNEVDNSEEYSNKYSQAINLGIYGTDLGYINMYSSYTSSLIFLGAVKDLAEELRVSQFFDFTTIRRLASNSENIDSILYISTDGFDKMNQYLRSEKRDDVSILMLVGGWLEALYILSSVNESHTTAELTERVGEQKMLCDNILFLVDLYKEDTYFAALGDKVRALKKEYDGVKINNTVGEQIEKEIDGVLVVESTSTSSIEMTDEVLAKVTAKIKSIRLSLIETNEK